MTSEPFAVGDLVAAPVTQVSGYCSVDTGEVTMQLPVVITHGSKPGPVLVVTAGIHGGEYVSILAVREFASGLDAATLKGTVIASLQSNPVSFERRSAFVNPLDGKNPNRAFPGDPSGNATDRLAAWLWGNFVSRADYYVNCHCGDLPESLDGFVGVSRGGNADVDTRARELADCFDVSHVMVTLTQGSALRAATLAGIPSVLVEVSGQGQWSAAEVGIQRDGLRRLATEIGVLESAGRPKRKRLPTFRAEPSVISQHAGSWFPRVVPGTSVLKDDVLGRVEDLFGAVLQDVLASIDGVVQYGLSSLSAIKGNVLAVIARPYDE